MDDERLGTISALMCSIVSGANILVARFGAGFLPHMFYTSASLFIAGLIGWVLVLLRRIYGELLALTSRKILEMSLIGAGIAVAFLFIFTGVSLTAVSNSFLLQTEVIYATVLGFFLLREKITTKQVTASIIVVIGDVIVMTEGSIKQVNMGDVLFLVAPFVFVVTNILAKDVMKTTDPSVVVAYRFTSGGLLLLFIQAFTGVGSLTLGLGPFQVLLVLTQGLFLATSSSLSHYAMKKINLSKASAIFIAYPVVSVALAILFLEEKVTLIRSVGGTMIFAGVLYMARLRSTLRNAK